MPNRLSRRSLLTLAGACGVGPALAGCFDSTSPPETADEDGAQNTDNGTDSDTGNRTDEDEVEGTEADSDGRADGTDETDGAGDADEELPEWMTTDLEDVTTGETFSLAPFEVPVLLETFAVWCPDCLDQQRESKQFHDQTDLDVESVALNVDPNEDADVVRRHVEDHGFDWHFAVAPGPMTRSLVDEFGDSIAHPPASPIVLVCSDGAFRRLDDGLNAADTLEPEVSSGC